MAKLLDTLAHAHLGGVPCTRTDCSACAKLAAGDAGVVVMPSPTPSPETTIPDLPPVPYTPQLIPELVFAPGDANVLARVQDGIHEEARLWWLNLQANRLSLASGFDELICLPLVRGVHQYDYQIATALKVLRELRGRALLADEVGLGKTIEAALILKEYVVRGLVRKALVLVPASLTVQWQEELREKFGLHFEIMDEVEDWERHEFVIASLDTAKRPLNQDIIEKLYYDLVIVDEAHKLRNRRTRNWKFVSSIRKKYILMLTATPVQNDLEELFNLVTLLKPGQMRTWGEFRREFFRGGDKRNPANPDGLRALLLEVMIRNRRGDAIVLPARRVDSIEVPLSPPERNLYDGVSAFVRRWYGAGPLANRLSLMVLQREIGSSPAAASQTLKRLRESPNFSWEERAELDQLYQKSLAVTTSDRGEHLAEFLRATPDKVLVFTQYYRTMAWLEDRLRTDGVTIATFHGGMNPAEKEAAVHAFKGPAQVFLSTEAGGEGRNLQFAHRLVNFDLPWNPLRLEQRIGRIHRVGQTHEVQIVNLWSPDTVEEYVLELLDKKVHMFELVVGELDMVLGNLDEEKTFEDLLMEIWTIEDAAKRRAEVAKLGEELAKARGTYETAKTYDDRLFGSGLEVGVGVAP
ncbi:MAG: ATP-dependent helicase [Methanobacteriota archaeon]|nr:MAG: ATP-dependent helicase [Euryarchaeota archaeon]